MNDYVLGGVIIAFVIVIFIIIMYLDYCMYIHTLSGVYIASPDFCDEAGLNNFIFTINSDENAGYIIAINTENEIIINNAVVFDIKWDMNVPSLSLMKERYGNIHLVDDIPGMPVDMRIEYIPLIGKILMYIDDTMYAALYRDAALTECVLVNATQDNL